MTNLVFQKRSQRWYHYDNTGTTRTQEKSVRRDWKALENQRSVYKFTNLFQPKRNSCSEFSCSGRRLNFKLLFYGFERPFQLSSGITNIFYRNRQRAKIKLFYGKLRGIQNYKFSFNIQWSVALVNVHQLSKQKARKSIAKQKWTWGAKESYLTVMLAKFIAQIDLVLNSKQWTWLNKACYLVTRLVKFYPQDKRPTMVAQRATLSKIGEKF